MCDGARRPRLAAAGAAAARGAHALGSFLKAFVCTSNSSAAQVAVCWLATNERSSPSSVVETPSRRDFARFLWERGDRAAVSTLARRHPMDDLGVSGPALNVDESIGGFSL